MTFIKDKETGLELVDLLLKKQAELNSLLEVTQAINNRSTPSVLFGMLEVVSKVHLKIGKMRLLIKEDQQFYCAMRFGGVFENAKNVLQMAERLKSMKVIMPLSNREDKLLKNYSFFIPVFHNDELMACVLIGDIGSAEFSDSDLNFLRTITNIIIVALENNKLLKKSLQNEVLQHEIELAREVQNMLVPLYLPYNKTLEIGALYMPSKHIGGDYFDFIPLNDHEFIWCIADVSGKGMAAALLMASLQASLRAWAVVESDLMKLITLLNKVVYRNTKGERFITLFLAKYNKSTKEVQYINAGHNPPILLAKKEQTLLNEGTTMLGAFEHLPFVNIGRLMIKTDTLVFNYTDGIVESADENVFIDEDELIKHVKVCRGMSSHELNASVLKNIQVSRKAKMDTDDITLMSLKIFVNGDTTKS